MVAEGRINGQRLTPGREPLLVVTCKDHLLEAFFLARRPLGRDGQIVTRMRIDDADAITERWNAATTGVSAFTPDPANFVQRLVGTERLVVEVTGIDGRQHRSSFGTRGLLEVSPEVVSCWRPRRG